MRAAARRRAAWNPAEATDAFGETHFKGYNLLLKDRESWRALRGKAVLTATFYLSGLLRRLAGKIWSVNLRRGFSPHLFAYPRHKMFLSKRGRWQAYASFCEGLGVSPDSFTTAKCFYLADLLDERLPGGPLSVLEIGAGPAVLATTLLTRRDVKRYVMVDIPEVLAAAEKTVKGFFPDHPVAYASQDPAALPEEGVVLMTPGECGRLARDAFDLTICVDVLPVMKERQVKEYLDLAQRATKPGGLFLTLNFRKQLGEYDNNPLLYPHHRNDVLIWETDPFHYEVLKFDLKDLFLLRLERVVKTLQLAAFFAFDELAPLLLALG